MFCILIQKLNFIKISEKLRFFQESVIKLADFLTDVSPVPDSVETKKSQPGDIFD